MEMNENLIAGVVSTTRRAVPHQVYELSYDDYDLPYYYSVGSLISSGLVFLGIVEVFVFSIVLAFGVIWFIIRKNKENTYKCSGCGKEFKHNGMKPKVCIECGAELKSPKCP
ncbi:hypothetical protein HDR58_01385 [bacterium]|nr:hypothetical protein [bacterium]